MTRLAEATDGLSQTIAVTEDAGRDARFLGEYSEYYITPVLTMTRPVPPGQRRFWRWGEPDSAIVSSTPINNKATPSHENSQYPTSGTTMGNGAGRRRRDLRIPSRGGQRPVRRRVGQVHQGEPEHRRPAVADHARGRRGGLVRRVLISLTPGGERSRRTAGPDVPAGFRQAAPAARRAARSSVNATSRVELPAQLALALPHEDLEEVVAWRPGTVRSWPFFTTAM